MMPLIKVEHKNGLVTYQSPLLNQAGVRHGFSTRIGGASQGPFASLNLALRDKSAGKDFNLAIAENFRRLRSALNVNRIARVELRQVHGDTVFHVAGRPTTPQKAPCADSAIYNNADRLLAIRTADCAAILLASKNGTVIAAVHAGWRGIVGGIVPNTVEKLQNDFAVHPDNLVAAIGPCISAEHFEVGQEVADEFTKAGLKNAISSSAGSEKPHIDLRAAVLTQLTRLGLLESAVDISDLCTYADDQQFYSYRRDGVQTGRMAAIIVAKKEKIECQ